MWTLPGYAFPEISVPKEVLLTVCARFFMKEFNWPTQTAHGNAVKFFNLNKVLNYTETFRGDWYVHGIRYPDGEHGMVTNRTTDGMWRIVRHPEAGYFMNRDDAARRELELAFRSWSDSAEKELHQGCFSYL